MSLIHEPEILSEVPESFKRLIRYIARGFYGIEHALIIDMLVRNPCMKEDDMLDLLKFERKQLRSHIKMLKNDKFLKERMKMETDSEGRATKHSYYFINYHVFVNVVKYKLDHMRRKIEMEERDSTNRASFKCPNCEKMYTDLEANQLFDMMTGTFRCIYCQFEVEEEMTSKPTADARTLMVKFNEQIEPIYMLLKDCEDIKLAPEILEPEPTDIKRLTRERGESAHARNQSDRVVWSGESNKNINYGYTENQVTVSVDDSNQSISAESKPVKERPIWMVESTVEGAISEPTIKTEKKVVPVTTPEDSAGGLAEKNDILQTLLAHEKKTGGVLVPGVPRAGSDEDSSTSESEDDGNKAPVASAAVAEVEEMESEDEVAMVTIGNMKVPYHDVTDEMVNRMTAQEKAAYIQIGQEMYEDMYD